MWYIPPPLGTNGIRKEDVQKAIKELKERRRKYEELEKKLKETGEDQISTIDEESRKLMIRSQNTELTCNIQITVNSKHNLVKDAKAVNTNDKKLACAEVPLSSFCQIRGLIFILYMKFVFIPNYYNILYFVYKWS